MLKGKTAVVTGSSGFIGSALSHKLREEDAVVIGLDKTTGFDLSHRGELRQLMMQGVDYVFHLAVLPFNPCTEDMRLCIDTNITGTLNVVEAAAGTRVKKIIYSSASAVYGNIDTVRSVDAEACQRRDS